MSFLSKLASFSLFFAALSLSPANAELSKEEFLNPPLQARPAALWTWLNGNVDHQQITLELEGMKEKGMRGAVIWDLGAIADPDKIVPTGPGFLGTESLKSIHHAMDEAERLGLELGMVAASSWNSGGSWIKPDNASKEILWSEVEIEGPSNFSAILPQHKGVGSIFEEISLVAVPMKAGKVIDSVKPLVLDVKPDADGHLNWSVPEGSWKLMRFINSNTDEGLKCPSPNSFGPVIDHLSREATDAHMNHILDTLLTGREDFGSLTHLMLDSYEVTMAMDWTPDFLNKFSEANGYDARPWLPVLAGVNVVNEEQSARFLHNYRKVVSDLLVADHYARCREVLNARGLKLLAEAGHGGYPRVDPLKALGAADIPMGEYWNNRKNWVTKEAASAAHIYGKTLVNAESLTGWQHWQDGPATYKRLTDIAFCAGLNQITFHTFAHNPPAAGLPGYAYHAGEHFNVNSTWWEQSAPMLADMARSSHLLQQGKFVADVAIYYGDNAPNLVPARRIAPTIKPRYKEDECTHCGLKLPVDLTSLGQGYDYDWVNEEVILERMEFRDGRIYLPDGMSYKILVLPDREAISPEALRKIGALVHAGATVVGRKPERSNSLRGFPEIDREVRELANKIWGDSDGEKVLSHNYGKGKIFWNHPLRKVLKELGVQPDFTVSGIDNKDQHIDFIHRKTEDENIYFVSNSSLETRTFEATFRSRSHRVPSFWNPEDGSIRPCNLFQVTEGFISIPMTLAPASSVFVVFSDDERPDHLVSISDNEKSAVKILSMDGVRVSAQISEIGEYIIKSAAGKTAKLVSTKAPKGKEIGGSWKVDFQENRGAPASVKMEKLIDWTESSDFGVRYFSGTAAYHHHFEITEPDGSLPAKLFLDLGTVKEVATVKVNGKEAGILWKQPYRIDIGSFLKSGINELEISVTNVWNNRLVGDKQTEDDVNITNTNLAHKFEANSPLLPSGLIGPVFLHTPVEIVVELK